MEATLFEMQLKKYIERLQNEEIEGIILCSNTVGDAPLETNKILKEYIEKYGPISNMEYKRQQRSTSCEVLLIFIV